MWIHKLTRRLQKSQLKVKENYIHVVIKGNHEAKQKLINSFTVGSSALDLELPKQTGFR